MRRLTGQGRGKGTFAIWRGRQRPPFLARTSRVTKARAPVRVAAFHTLGGCLSSGTVSSSASRLLCLPLGVCGGAETALLHPPVSPGRNTWTGGAGPEGLDMRMLSSVSAGWKPPHLLSAPGTEEGLYPQTAVHAPQCSPGARSGQSESFCTLS